MEPAVSFPWRSQARPSVTAWAINQWINQAWVSTVEAQKGAELQGILSITACPPLLDSVKCLWPMYGPDPP